MFLLSCCIGGLFWLVVLAASTGFLYIMIMPTLETDGWIYFAPDTRYLEWSTNFPGITVCEQTNTKFAQRTLAKLYPELLKPLSYDHQRYLTELLYGRGKCSKVQCSSCGDLVPCDVPWREIVENVHKKCNMLISDCSYNGVEIPCCQTFLPADSEHGPCYTFNALQNVNLKEEHLYSVNITTGPGRMAFTILSDAEISIHSNEELSTNSLSAKFKFPVNLLMHTNVDILFSVVEIENDPVLHQEDIIQRNCRYPNEIPKERFHTYSVYSHGACTLAQNTEHSFHHCGCVSPVRDISYEDLYCNYTGLNCITQYEVLKNKLGLDKSDEEDVEDCLASCVESELYIRHQSKRWIPENAGTGISVNIAMSALPTLRYQRKLLRTALDFVVSVGGMAGLFFGASLLSIVEIFYLILRKP